jgi:hypothetical protein
LRRVRAVATAHVAPSLEHRSRQTLAAARQAPLHARATPNPRRPAPHNVAPPHLATTTQVAAHVTPALGGGAPLHTSQPALRQTDAPPREESASASQIGAAPAQARAPHEEPPSGAASTGDNSARADGVQANPNDESGGKKE